MLQFVHDISIANVVNLYNSNREMYGYMHKLKSGIVLYLKMVGATYMPIERSDLQLLCKLISSFTSEQKELMQNLGIFDNLLALTVENINDIDAQWDDAEVLLNSLPDLYHIDSSAGTLCGDTNTVISMLETIKKYSAKDDE